MKYVLTGKINNHSLNGHSREFVSLVLPFSTAKRVFRPYKYDANNDVGEQRGEVTSQIRLLSKELENGHYTPAPVHAGVYDVHTKVMERHGDEVTISWEDRIPPLPLTNGQQRFCAIQALLDKAIKAGDTAKQDLINSCPIPILLLLDGNTKEDFIHLQLGKKVDASQLCSMKIATGRFKEKDLALMNLCMQAARRLDTDCKSPLHKSIKFDSNPLRYMPINTLISNGASDNACSLYGFAKLAVNAEDADGVLIANTITECYNKLFDAEPRLFDPKFLLCPPPDGTKGGATLMVGIASLYFYKQLVLEQHEDNYWWVNLDESLVTHAKTHFLKTAGGNLSGPIKRQIMGRFALDFFEDLWTPPLDTDGKSVVDQLPVRPYDCIPTPLVELWGTSCLNLKPFPKKGDKSKTVKTEVEETEEVEEEND
jgi:hypothetical protein